MNFHDKLIIAVDFDGTIVEDGYPGIGKPRLFAFETLHKLQENGHRLILWTYRSGKSLDQAVAFCKENGIEFYAGKVVNFLLWWLVCLRERIAAKAFLQFFGRRLQVAVFHKDAHE